WDPLEVDVTLDLRNLVADIDAAVRIQVGHGPAQRLAIDRHIPPDGRWLFPVLRLGTVHRAVIWRITALERWHHFGHYQPRCCRQPDEDDECIEPATFHNPYPAAGSPFRASGPPASSRRFGWPAPWPTVQRDYNQFLGERFCRKKNRRNLAAICIRLLAY